MAILDDDIASGCDVIYIHVDGAYVTMINATIIESTR